VASLETSTEYRSHQIQYLYNLYLNRFADAQGLADDIAFLQNGGTVEQLAAVISASAEFFQSSLSGGTNEGFLDHVYKAALGRPLEAGGKAVWLQAFANGATPFQVAGAILTSGEYQQHLVQRFYQQFLKRDADSAGLNAWVALLQQGTRDETVIAAILGSAEYFNNPRP
jgi:hypothetical protein